MRKFSYRFQKLEELRKNQLRKIQQELKKIKEELKLEKKVLNLLRNDHRDYREKLKDKSLSSLDLREFSWYGEYLEVLRTQIRRKKENLLKYRLYLREIKKTAGKKEKEKKVLEKAREKKFNLFLSESKKEEQKELDEINRVLISKSH